MNLTNIIENNENINQVSITPVCSICLKEKSQYTCPRCNIKYCSVTCYKHKKHQSCSELFYKDWVMQEIKENKSSQEDKQKVLEMLARVEEDNPGRLDSDDDDELTEDLEERLHGLDLEDSESVLKKLTGKERKEFEKLLQDGRLGNLVEIWTPWWKESKDLIEEVDKLQPSTKQKQPSLYKDIPDICTLIKAKPSSDIRNNIINILYSYAFVCRLHNGGHFDCPIESAEDLLNICCVLSEGKNFISLEEAIENTFIKVQKESQRLDLTSEFIVGILDDIEIIIRGPDKLPSLHYILLAISDLISLFKSAKKTLQTEIKKSKKCQSSDKELKSVCYQAEKKCIFLLSWTHRYGMAVISLLPELQLEISRRKTDLKQVEDVKVALEQNWGGKLPPKKSQLISEIN